MADSQSHNGHPIEPSQPAKQVDKPISREFIHVDTAENSRLNKGQDENIYIEGKKNTKKGK